MATLQFFPEEFILLQQEILNHPVLMHRLQKHHDTDSELQFAKCVAEICTYLGIQIEGTFGEMELTKLAGICVMELRRKDAPEIFSGAVAEVEVKPPSNLILLNGEDK